MQKQRLIATVTGQSVIHVEPQIRHINKLETRKVNRHLIGELRLTTEDEQVIHVLCPMTDGCVVVDEDVPSQKLGMQLYNTLVNRHPFGSKRAILHTQTGAGANVRHAYTMLTERVEVFNQQLTQQLQKTTDQINAESDQEGTPEVSDS